MNIDALSLGLALGLLQLALVAAGAWWDPEIWLEDYPASARRSLPPMGPTTRSRRRGMVVLAGVWRGLFLVIGALSAPHSVVTSVRTDITLHFTVITITAQMTTLLLWRLSALTAMRPAALMIPTTARQVHPQPDLFLWIVVRCGTEVAKALLLGVSAAWALHLMLPEGLG